MRNSGHISIELWIQVHKRQLLQIPQELTVIKKITTSITGISDNNILVVDTNIFLLEVRGWFDPNDTLYIISFDELIVIDWLSHIINKNWGIPTQGI